MGFLAYNINNLWNKIKIFKEALTKAKNKENFDWPFRYRSIRQYGNSRWDRVTTNCLQCRIMLDWDITAYEDSQGHKCFQCCNCQKQIEKNQQDQHFIWNLDNSLNYKC